MCAHIYFFYGRTVRLFLRKQFNKMVVALRAGSKHTRGNPMGFLVQRLNNHLTITAVTVSQVASEVNVYVCFKHFVIICWVRIVQRVGYERNV